MSQKLVIVDVEADGPCPGLYSMVCFGAVILDDCAGKWRTFYGQTAPYPGAKWIPEALAVSGFLREEHEKFPTAYGTMIEFSSWISDQILEHGHKPIFVSDNLAFDWQFINFYYHYYLNKNQFGHSGRRIGDVYCGIKKDLSKNAEWKKLFRKTKHDHNPVNDAIGNAESLLSILKNNNIRLGGVTL